MLSHLGVDAMYSKYALHEGTRHTMGSGMKGRCVDDVRRMRGMSTGAGRGVVRCLFWIPVLTSGVFADDLIQMLPASFRSCQLTPAARSPLCSNVSCASMLDPL